MEYVQDIAKFGRLLENHDVRIVRLEDSDKEQEALMSELHDFMVESRAERKTNEKNTNKIIAVLSVISIVSPIIAPMIRAWLENLVK